MKIKILFTIIALVATTSCYSSDGKSNKAPQMSKEQMFVDDLLVQSENFVADDIVRGLPGEWVVDSEFVYDSEWKEIVETHIFQGVHQLVGLANVTYTFATDGKGLYYSTNVSLGPNEPPYTYGYEWNYDVEGKKLVMSNEDMRIECVVSGFNGTYLILDRTDHVYDSYTDKHTYSYIREILKKRQN